MRNFNPNSVEANRGISQVRVNVFAIEAYARSAFDCLRYLSSGLRDCALGALPAHQRWQLVPSVVKTTTGTGRRQAVQASITMLGTPARLS